MNTKFRDALDTSIDNLRRDRTNNPELYNRLFKTLGALLHTVRCELDDVRLRPIVNAPMEARTVATIEREMRAGALLAGWERGASEKQISLIIALAVKANDFGPICNGGHFTKRDASHVIDAFKA